MWPEELEVQASALQRVRTSTLGGSNVCLAGKRSFRFRKPRTATGPLRTQRLRESGPSRGTTATCPLRKDLGKADVRGRRLRGSTESPSYELIDAGCMHAETEPPAFTKLSHANLVRRLSHENNLA